ncbi:MAG TPA: carbon monoxide dehydrogenase subunit G [Vicinamibacterales bacterium]|nr:carbon monoxide dehydrogenase subunit G [Vicinamibacterales bacterium]
MNLQYNGEEQIPADPATVWSFVNDPEKIGRCLPDVQTVTVHDPRHFDAVVRVAVGPVRGKFTFKFELQPNDATRRIDMRISGGGFGSAVDLTAGADVVPAEGTGTTLRWNGNAVMRGPVAAVGGRVLDGQAKKLITQTFANVRGQLTPTG